MENLKHFIGFSLRLVGLNVCEHSHPAVKSKSRRHPPRYNDDDIKAKKASLEPFVHKYLQDIPPEPDISHRDLGTLIIFAVDRTQGLDWNLLGGRRRRGRIPKGFIRRVVDDFATEWMMQNDPKAFKRRARASSLLIRSPLKTDDPLYLPPPVAATMDNVATFVKARPTVWEEIQEHQPPDLRLIRASTGTRGLKRPMALIPTDRTSPPASYKRQKPKFAGEGF